MKQYSKKYALLAVFAAFALSAPAVRAQVPQLQPGADTTGNEEHFPTPRDPRYTPPLISEEQRRQLDSGGESVLLLSGEDLDAATVLESQRAQAAAARAGRERYEERDANRLDEQGNRRAAAERAMLRQFGTDGFPRGFGQVPYTETPARRFSIVFFLSLPFTAGFTFGAWGLGKSIAGEPTRFDTGESIAGISLALVLSAGIAYYDHRTAYGEAAPSDESAEQEAQSHLERERHFSGHDIARIRFSFFYH